MSRRKQRPTSAERSTRREVSAAHEALGAGRLAEARPNGRRSRGRRPGVRRTGTRGRRLGVVAVALIAALLGVGWWLAAPAPAHAGEITVYKSPTCQCCELWLRHMRRAGFEVTERNVPDMAAIKMEHGVPGALASCHTTLVGGYVVEGHVPADLVVRLLDERPAVAGLAVPGMPVGSPGMEGIGRQAYEVLTFTRDGETEVYARR